MSYNVFMSKTITCRIPAALLTKLEKIAKTDERTVSFVLRKAAEAYVATKGGK